MTIYDSHIIICTCMIVYILIIVIITISIVIMFLQLCFEDVGPVGNVQQFTPKVLSSEHIRRVFFLCVFGSWPLQQLKNTRLLFSFFLGIPLLVLNILVVKPPYTVVISSMSVALQQWCFLEAGGRNKSSALHEVTLVCIAFAPNLEKPEFVLPCFHWGLCFT